MGSKATDWMRLINILMQEREPAAVQTVLFGAYTVLDTANFIGLLRVASPMKAELPAWPVLLDAARYGARYRAGAEAERMLRGLM